MFKKLVLLMGMFVLIVGLAACGEASDAPEVEVEVETSVDGSSMRFVPTGYDRAGFEFIAPETPTRIISAAPAITVVLVDLGLSNYIVAFDQHSAMMFPEIEAMSFDAFSPSIEALIELEPDLLLSSVIAMQGDETSDPFVQLRELGVAVAYIATSNSIADIKLDVGFIGYAVGHLEGALALIVEMEAELDVLEEEVSLVDVRPTVLFEVSPLPEIFSMGSGTFLHEMVWLAGGENVFGHLQDWFPVEEESIVELNPEVIMTNFMWSEESPVDEILNRAGWQGVSAVANGRVYFIDNDHTSLPNHHIVHGIRAMFEALHGSE